MIKIEENGEIAVEETWKGDTVAMLEKKLSKRFEMAVAVSRESEYFVMVSYIYSTIIVSGY